MSSWIHTPSPVTTCTHSQALSTLRDTTQSHHSTHCTHPTADMFTICSLTKSHLLATQSFHHKPVVDAVSCHAMPCHAMPFVPMLNISLNCRPITVLYRSLPYNCCGLPHTSKKAVAGRMTGLFVCLVFHGTFSTNRPYCAITVGKYYHVGPGDNVDIIKQ